MFISAIWIESNFLTFSNWFKDPQPVFERRFEIKVSVKNYVLQGLPKWTIYKAACEI